MADDDVDSLTVAALKQRLKAFGLAPGNARKAELAQRLRHAIAADAREEEELLAELADGDGAPAAALLQIPDGLSLPFPLSTLSPPPRSPEPRGESPSPPASPREPSWEEEADNFSELVYKPHTITALFVAGAGVLYVGLGDQSDLDEKQSWAQATQAVCLVFLVYAALQFRDGILLRPHPVFWRLIHGMAIIYLLGLVFLFMQPKRWGREWLQIFDPELGKEAPLENTKEYATDCRLIDEGGFPSAVLRATFFDVFVFSHFVGWLGFAIIMRDTKVVWTMSILFEILEISAQDVMVNFQECWWDHLGLDLFGANAAGIYCGMRLVRYFEIKEYNWVGLRELPSLGAKMKRVASQVATPSSFTAYDWDVFASFRRFACLVFIICLLDAVQLSVFFLKYALWMPPSHWVVMSRTMLWIVLAIPACREFYQFTVNDNDPWARLGPNGWMAIAIFCMEVAVSVKYGQGEYAGKGEISKEVMTAWLASALFLALWMLVYFRKVDALLPARFSDTQQLALDWLFISIPLPLLGLGLRELLRTFDDFGVSAALFGREVHTALLNRD